MIQRSRAALAGVLLLLSAPSAFAQTVLGWMDLNPAAAASITQIAALPGRNRVLVAGGTPPFAVRLTMIDADNPAAMTSGSTSAVLGGGVAATPDGNHFWTAHHALDGTYRTAAHRYVTGLLYTAAGEPSPPMRACLESMDLTGGRLFVTQCGGWTPAVTDSLWVVSADPAAPSVMTRIDVGGVPVAPFGAPGGGVYVTRRGMSTAYFVPAGSTYLLAGTIPESVLELNDETGRIYATDGANLIVRNNEGIVATIPGVTGRAALHARRNIVYVANGSTITAINGLTNTVAGTVTLDTGVIADGPLTVDPINHRLYLVASVGTGKRLYAFDVGGPACELAVTVSDATVTLSSFRLRNTDRLPATSEMKTWFRHVARTPVKLFSLPGDGTITLPAGLDHDFGPFPLGTIGPSWPRGDYQVGCRLLDPVTGTHHAESIRTFEVR